MNVANDAKCVQCGCVDSRACAGGCSWLWVDRDERTGLCSACAPDIEPVAWTRDGVGQWFHPVLKAWPLETSYAPLLEAAGLTSMVSSLYDDASEAVRQRYEDAGDADFSYWDLSPPPGVGWFLFGAYDTEDGPVACWVIRATRQSGGTQS